MMATVIFMNEVSERLFAAIQNSGLSYGELAKQTGIPKSAIQRYATGGTEKIPVDRIELLAPAIGTTAQHILGWDAEKLSRNLTKHQAELIDIIRELPPEQQDSAIDQLAGIVQLLLSQGPR